MNMYMYTINIFDEYASFYKKISRFFWTKSFSGYFISVTLLEFPVQCDNYTTFITTEGDNRGNWDCIVLNHTIYYSTAQMAYVQANLDLTNINIKV